MTEVNKLANRYGLDISICNYEDGNMNSNGLLRIDFANVSDISVSSDKVWATGGQNHTKRLGFDNPYEGTFKISTQIMANELMLLMAGKPHEYQQESESITFNNGRISQSGGINYDATKYYTIHASTIWIKESENGVDDPVTYHEYMTFHKVTPKRAYNVSYSGDGDPISVDIEFELMEDDSGRVLTISKQEAVFKSVFIPQHTE